MKFKFVPFFLSVQTYSKMYRNIFIKTKKLRSTNVFIIIFINFVITIAIFLGRKISHITGENKFSKLAKKLRSRTKCKLSQGSILLWLEIHQPSSLPPPLDISEKPPAEFQARLIIWQTSGVADADVEGTSDLYVRAFVNDNKPKETDTHYRCQNGKGQFN